MNSAAVACLFAMLAIANAGLAPPISYGYAPVAYAAAPVVYAQAPTVKLVRVARGSGGNNRVAGSTSGGYQISAWNSDDNAPRQTGSSSGGSLIPAWSSDKNAPRQTGSSSGGYLIPAYSSSGDV